MREAGEQYAEKLLADNVKNFVARIYLDLKM